MIITVELLLSRLSGAAIHLDMQKIRIIGIFFEKKATLAVRIYINYQLDALTIIYS